MTAQWYDVDDAEFDPTTFSDPTAPAALGAPGAGPGAGPDADSPFSGVAEVDGIVYAEQTLSPELRIAPGTFAQPPVPKRRAAPVKPRPTAVAAWQPGDPVTPAAFKPKAARPPVLRSIVLGLVPLALIVGLLLVVMDLYGMR